MGTFVKWLAALGAILGGAASAAEPSIPVTVAEPAGVERKREPASGGVPLVKGQVKSVEELALFTKDGQAVPAQFSRLAAYEDGSVQWALLDLLVDLPAGGKAEFLVKPGKAAAPERPLDIRETDDSVTVDAGAARFTVNKARFSLLESVEQDGRKVAGPGSVDITSAEGKAFKAGKPSKVSWEYKGPVRATLRVDGEYLGEADAPYISYTTRLSFWAGSAAVRVEHSVRNSNPKEGNDARIKEASLSLDFKGAQTAKGAGWLACAEGPAGLLVSHHHTGGAFPGKNPAFQKLQAAGGKVTVWVIPPTPGAEAKEPAPAGEPPPKKKRPSFAGAVGYGEDFFALADCAHKDSRVWLDFGKGDLDAATAGKRHQARVSGLHALADGAWVSETGCMGYGRFGTLQDEINTYKQWGWKGWDDPKKMANARKAHDPNAYVDRMDVHDESESDSAELGLLMYLRTGERGWFDLGEAYARYYKGHMIFRTDGFEHDGFRHERAGVVQKSKRACKGLAFGWYGPKEYGWSDTRMHMCHFWGNGAFDYYCLTGDVDSLEAGLDMAEYAALTYYDAVPGKSTLGPGRAWGRQFQCVTRAYELTRDPKWKAASDHFGQWAIKAPNRHPSGLYYGFNGSYIDYFMRDHLEPRNQKDPPVLPKVKAYIEEHGISWKREHGELVFTDKAGKSWKWWESAQSFEFEACDGAIFRYAEVMDSAEARKIVVDLARGARDYYWSKKCDQAIPHPFINFLEEGKSFDRGAWDDDHKNCPGDNGGKHSGYHTRFFTDIFARAYVASGDKEWLDWAKRAWNRGSKRGYWVTSQGFPDDEVAAFVGHSAPKGDALDIRNSMRMFYEVPRAK